MTWLHSLGTTLLFLTALAGTLLGLAHVALAGLWMATGEDSPSAMPAVGPLLGVVLGTAFFLFDDDFTRVAAAGACLAIFVGEISVVLAGIFVRYRRRKRRPPS